MEIFLRYSQIFVKGDFIIGRVECMCKVVRGIKIIIMIIEGIIKEVKIMKELGVGQWMDRKEVGEETEVQVMVDLGQGQEQAQIEIELDVSNVGSTTILQENA